MCDNNDKIVNCMKIHIVWLHEQYTSLLNFLDDNLAIPYGDAKVIDLLILSLSLSFLTVLTVVMTNRVFSVGTLRMSVTTYINDRIIGSDKLIKMCRKL